MSRRSLFTTLLVAAVAGTLLAACTTLDDFQRQVIFRPSKESGRTPAEFSARYEDVWLAAGSQPGKLHAWWIPAKSGGKDAPAALYLRDFSEPAAHHEAA
jgi:hypothetical protein